MLNQTDFSTQKTHREAVDKPAATSRPASSRQRLEQLWQSDTHTYHHVRMLAHHSQGAADYAVLTTGPKGQFTALVSMGTQHAAALSQGASAPQAARTLLVALPERADVTVPDGLAAAIVREARGKYSRPVHVVSRERYFTRPQGYPVFKSDDRIALASQCPRELIARELAGCALLARGEMAPAAAFEQLLQSSDALIWRQRGFVRAFQIFTPLERGQIVVGGAIGDERFLPHLFNALLAPTHQASDSMLTVCVDERNHRQLAKVQAHGFSPYKNMGFTTLHIA